MPGTPPLPFSRRRRAAALAAAALLLGGFLVGHTALVLQTRGLAPNLPTVVANLLNGLVWVALAPLAVRAARRFPVVGGRWGRHLLAHAAFALVANAAVGAFVLAVTRPIDPGSPPPGFLFVSNFLVTAPLYLLLWLVVVLLTHAFGFARRFRERDVHAARLEARAARLEGQLTHARLEALRMQLNPHFLFNTLHAASTLMGRDVGAARTVLAELSDLLRLALDRSDEPEVTLDDELDFLRHYLRIERVRFRDRLAVEEAVAPGVGAALVPSLLLQPLVENALKHGVAPRAGGGRVRIAARRAGADLVLSVEDDGPGLAEDGRPGGGVGLRNTRERLASLYGDGAALRLRDRPGGGLVAEVRLPFHTAPVALPA